MKALFADIILPFPLKQHFTYAVPEELHEFIIERGRVVVQFGSKRYYTGIVTALHDQKPEVYEVKEISAVIDKIAIINQKQLDFWHWLADYYMCSVGEVMKAALPAGLKLESESAVSFNPEFEDFKSLNDIEKLILEFVQKKSEVLIKEINIEGYKKSIFSYINRLHEKQALYIHESLNEKYVPKKESYVNLTAQAAEESFLNNILVSLKKAPKQLELLETYLNLSKAFDDSEIMEVKKSHLLEMSSASSASLKGLVEKGVLEIYTKEKNRISDRDISIKDLKLLSEAQQIAYEEIKMQFQTLQTVLLHGITSSGKTEIYIHLIRDCIEKNQQVLYLLPEIAITAQIIHRLQAHFGNKVSVYHSKYSDNERVEIWNRLQSSEQDRFHIILGVRSSTFLPFHNLGLIIVDEEHESSFKQYNPAPRYHARDAAIVLAGMHNAKVLLGTATPAVETYYNTQTGKFGLVNLSTRFQDIKLPEIKLVNMPVARKKGNVKSHFSNQLLEAIEKSLAEKKQVILFQNRRGFSPFIECPQCGWAPRCKHCDVTLTYHKYQNQLVCHYCSYAIKVPPSCPECKSNEIKTVGFGTEKVEEELSIMYPEAKVARMDLDSTSNKHAHEHIISAFENGRIDILVGTQMISKGLDFSNVNLTGILNADNMLNFPDFRAFERSFQLMVQVGGRAGRKNERGLVIIQTSMPGHPIIKDVVHHDYQSLYKSQITERSTFKYPPFFRIISVTLKHRDEQVCAQASIHLVTELSVFLGNRVLGPDRPLISRIQNLHLRNITLKIEREAPLSKLKKQISEKAEKVINSFKSLQISIDVDPI